jgi:sugar O-acyltransferase (sialic acid O-acetyltransferase NeuD family)
MASQPYLDIAPDFRRLYIFGAGGSGREVAWLAEQLWGEHVERDFLVDQPEYLLGPVNGVPVRLLGDADGTNSRFVVAVGDPQARRSIVQRCVTQGLRPTRLIHPRVEMSIHNEVGEGTILCAGSIVTTNVSIGAHVQVNIACTISHEVRIGDFTTLSPGVHVAGNVVIGRDVFIGIGVNIINGQSSAPLVIGDGAVIAAGACVTRSVEAGALMVGVPAVRKR